MKLYLSLFLMGIVSNAAALRPVLLRRIRSPRTSEDPEEVATTFAEPIGRAATRSDSGFVHVPALPTLAERDSAMLLMQRVLIASTLLGRLFLQLQVDFRRAQTMWLTQAPVVLKRSFDIFVSFVMLLLLSPLFAVVWLLVKLEDGGPFLFIQTRVGQDGREFKMYKIRSMCMDAEKRLREVLGANHHKQGVTFKLKDDPRITRVGKWLRKFSMDELPQFYNVLVGDMSLVGPRPPVPREVALYTLADRRRLAIKPGITCIWQIRGRSQIDFSDQVLLDVDYIENQSFWMDVAILFKTIPAVISTRGAC